MARRLNSKLLVAFLKKHFPSTTEERMVDVVMELLRNYQRLALPTTEAFMHLLRDKRICESYEKGMSATKLGELYGISQIRVRHIVGKDRVKKRRAAKASAQLEPRATWL